MPDDSQRAKPPADGVEDDVRKRFAALGDAAEGAIPQDDLPPVPDVKIERPGQPKPQRRAAGAGFDNAGDRAPVVRGMYGGGDMRSSGQALTIGTSLVASIIVGTGGGWLVDKYLLHSTGTPWGLIAGFLLGVASGFINLIRVTNQLNRD